MPEHSQVVVGHGLLRKPAVNVTRRNLAGGGHPQVAQVARRRLRQAVKRVQMPAFFAYDATTWEHPCAIIGPNVVEAFKQAHHVVRNRDGA